MFVSEQPDEPEVKEANDFSSAIDRLKEIVRDLEEGELALEEAMNRYEEGIDLIEFCESKLEEAELMIEEVDDTGPGEPTMNPKEPDE